MKIRFIIRLFCLMLMAFSTFPLFALCDSEIRIVDQPRRQIKVLIDNREIAVFHSGDALDKSYVHPLWTPDHHCLTYDAPADHLHHRALCIGWPDVSGTDFWAEINSPPGKRGQIQTTRLESKRLPDGSALIVETNRWLTEDGEELVKGKHTWTFKKPEGNLQMMDVDLDLEAVAPEVVFGSDPGAPREYHGLTIRIGPLNDIRYFNSEGIEGGQNCKGKPARWCAASGTQHGAPVTAAILDHPSNGDSPTRFYIQDQGMQFISSSPNFGQPKVLKKGEHWILRYRVLAAGRPAEEDAWRIDDLWRKFAASPIE